jgi:hypothetical protein
MLAKRRVVTRKTDAWSEQIAYYRFINNDKVTEEALTKCATEHCAAACEGMDEALLIQDTTELNLEAHRERIRDDAGLGEVGNRRQRYRQERRGQGGGSTRAMRSPDGRKRKRYWGITGNDG